MRTKEENALYMRAYLKTHPEYSSYCSALQCEKRKLLRQEIIDKLGGKCKCGYADPRALQIDHINGDATADKKEKGMGDGRSGYTYVFLRRILADPEFASKYQILCANCNWIKRAENREFNKGVAHKKPKYNQIN